MMRITIDRARHRVPACSIRHRSNACRRVIEWGEKVISGVQVSPEPCQPQPESNEWLRTSEGFRRRVSESSSDMMKAGEVYESPVTGERAVIRIGTDITGGDWLVVDLYIQPGAAVMGEHVHPGMEERFTVLRGRVGFRFAGQVSIAETGVLLIAPPGTPHDWWNAGPDEALVRFEMRPAAADRAEITVWPFGTTRPFVGPSRKLSRVLDPWDVEYRLC